MCGCVGVCVCGGGGGGQAGRLCRHQRGQNGIIDLRGSETEFTWGQALSEVKKSQVGVPTSQRTAL